MLQRSSDQSGGIAEGPVPGPAAPPPAIRPDQEKVDISFFVPCLNEEDNVAATLDTIVAACRPSGFAYEIFVVDDHSTDRTASVVREYCGRFPDLPITLVCNNETWGLGRNYLATARRAAGKYYMLVNGDNVEPVDSIRRIISHLGEADMIIPYFPNDRRGSGRRILSRLFTGLVNLLGGNWLRYYNGPVVHLRNNVAESWVETGGFAYQAEIITALLRRGASFLEIEVENTDRRAGSSKAFRCKNFQGIAESLMRIALQRVRKAGRK